MTYYRHWITLGCGHITYSSETLEVVVTLICRSPVRLLVKPHLIHLSECILQCTVHHSHPFICARTHAHIHTHPFLVSGISIPIAEIKKWFS